MNIEINVSITKDKMTQAESQRIVRCSNVFIEAGANVKINWGRDVPYNADQSNTHPYRIVNTNYR